MKLFYLKRDWSVHAQGQNFGKIAKTQKIQKCYKKSPISLLHKEYGLWAGKKTASNFLVKNQSFPRIDIENRKYIDS